MSSSLQRRVKNLEATTEFKDESNRLKIVMGYIQHLPSEYQGPRYLVIRERLPLRVGRSRGASAKGLRGRQLGQILCSLS
jgi:hypothetical protein